MTDHGYISRDYASDPLGADLPLSDASIYPRDEWQDLMDLQEQQKSSPLHVHKWHNVPILDQARLKYCWAFCLTAGCINRLAHAGINDPLPVLSATSLAATVKNFRNVGGYVLEAARAAKNGIADVTCWPERMMSRHLESMDEVKESKSINRLITFSELPKNNLSALVSVLIDPNHSRPVAIALPWWRHAVLALRARYDDSRIAIDFANSYGKQWKRNGFGTLYGDDAVAHEQIVIENMQARSE